MADVSEKQDGARDAADQAGEAGCAPSTTKRPYSRPTLRSLGKVAEITFGPGGSVSDGGGKASGRKHG
jgi:hypothetical protein